MLPSTRFDVYDNDKGRRGWNLAASSFLVTLRKKGMMNPRRLFLLLVGLTAVGFLLLHTSAVPSQGSRRQNDKFSGPISRRPPHQSAADIDSRYDSEDEVAAPKEDDGGEIAGKPWLDEQELREINLKETLEEEKVEEGMDEGIPGWEGQNTPADDNDENGDVLEDVSDGGNDGDEVDPGEQAADEVGGEWIAEKERVVEAFQHAWKGYKTYAWGYDELHPLSHRGSNWFTLGLTLVDSLDLMLMMGLVEEYNEARDWVANSMTFQNNGESNLFEVTIRVLGGLLSAHALSGDQMYVEKAHELGNRLMSAFTSGSPVPLASVNLRDSKGIAASHNGGDSSTAEVATIQLEFSALSHLTGDPTYATTADNVIRHLRTLPKTDGLVPIFINPYSGTFSGDTIRLGSRGDSYYEYLLKQWLHTGKTEAWHREMYDEAVAGIKKRLLHRSKPSGLLYVAELEGGGLVPKMDHLVCFLPGVLALGATQGKTEEEAKPFMTAKDLEDLEIAKELTYTCYQMYERMPTKLAPEIVFFNTEDSGSEDIFVKPADAHNLLRPETIESIFILYRITRDVKYREWGWKMFQAFEKHTKVPEGFTSIDNVKDPNGPKRDKMESFFLGETLKYFFLLFSKPSLIPLTKYVFNTEAHPLPILTKGLNLHVPAEKQKN